jgi:hypothetical protein
MTVTTRQERIEDDLGKVTSPMTGRIVDTEVQVRAVPHVLADALFPGHDGHRPDGARRI